MENNINDSGITRKQFIQKAAVLSAFFIVPRHVLGGTGFVPPSDKITLGFIGAGRQSLTLQKNFLPLTNAQIVAVSDVYEAKVNNFANLVSTYYAQNKPEQKYASIKTYHNYKDILSRKDIDAVVIATPDHWHAVIGVQAANAGKDIYCEKPLSLTVAEGRAMVKAVRKNKRVFQTGSMQRSWPEFRQAAELVRNGYLGELKEIKVSVGGPPVDFNLPQEPVATGLDWNTWLGPNEYIVFNHELNPAVGVDLWARWRDFKGFGGGGMTDWGAHMFDIAQWALDMDESGPGQVIPPDGKENAFLTYIYGNGVKMYHENFGKQNAMRFIGTEATIDVQRHKITLPPALQNKQISENEKHVYLSTNHYDDWLTAIKKRSKPICDVETGHRTATVCNIGNIAYELKKPLKWDPKTEKFNDADANQLLSRKMRSGFNIL
ncbi:Gfo/Idh/MocA family oxidoreductase [Mucilaginibacter sabulilitoris]|uniref:Gfo/Idh/MocA family oxidoreductase n=1 Tax=Mucilaginibacter sabulilitoris TaxID=1173583 RepID=A0ABZ0THS8_9SPHI|nr:Gfo/Idh/MocA family oxidoreductase [Mucilaginibacter sabulilitoris]WPU92717.1 Gfo/Idh/MocA family oxidoreductase [Mucilaginibacter sabulilitoris]